MLGATSRVVIEEGRTAEVELDVRLEMAPLAGRVRMPDGSGVRGIEVSVSSVAFGEMLRHDSTLTYSGAGDEFAFEVPRGPWTFEVSAYDGAQEVSRWDLRAGDEGVDLVLEETGLLHLHYPVAARAQEWMLLSRRPGQAEFEPDLGVPVLQTGIVSGYRLPVGEWEIAMLARPGACPSVSRVFVPREPDVATIVLDLPPMRKGTVRIQVSGAIGADWSLRFEPVSQWPGLNVKNWLRGSLGPKDLDSEGRARVDWLCDVRYRVTAQPEDQVHVEPEEVGIGSEGEELVLRLEPQSGGDR